MSPLGHLEDAFRSIFGYAPVEPGEFDAPEADAVERARAEVEALKDRMRAVTPVAPGPNREGHEL